MARCHCTGERSIREEQDIDLSDAMEGHFGEETKRSTIHSDYSQDLDGPGEDLKTDRNRQTVASSPVIWKAL